MLFALVAIVVMVARAADSPIEPTPTPAPQLYVLEFDGTPKTVDSGPFFPESGALGPFYWEARVQPGPSTNNSYIVSDGYGGAHAILFGFSGALSGQLAITGNVWNGSSYTSFGSPNGPRVGEWATVGVGWDGATITVYVNGAPVGHTPFAGPRMAVGPNNSGGRVLVGGSDHLNFTGRIAWVKGFEGASTNSGAPSLHYDFSANLAVVPDLSGGYRGQTHNGRLRGVTSGIMVECPSCPLPVYVER